MGRIRWVLLALAVVLGTNVGHADWHSFWERFKLDYHRNNAWPHPFREMAASQTRAPFEIQRNNGWQLHNTISHELFSPGDGALTYAGQKQLENIVTRVPPEHRTVFVVRAASKVETESRVAAVQSSLGRLSPDGVAPQVLVIDRAPATSSGEVVAALNRLRIDTMPKPQLPERAGPSASGE